MVPLQGGASVRSRNTERSSALAAILLVFSCASTAMGQSTHGLPELLVPVGGADLEASLQDRVVRRELAKRSYYAKGRAAGIVKVDVKLLLSLGQPFTITPDDQTRLVVEPRRYQHSPQADYRMAMFVGEIVSPAIPEEELPAGSRFDFHRIEIDVAKQVFNPTAGYRHPRSPGEMRRLEAGGPNPGEDAVQAAVSEVGDRPAFLVYAGFRVPTTGRKFILAPLRGGSGLHVVYEPDPERSSVDAHGAPKDSELYKEAIRRSRQFEEFVEAWDRDNPN